MDIKGKCFCGSGKKHRKCHSTVMNNSKLASLYIDYKNFDLKLSLSGTKTNCIKNCYSCCYDFFFISDNGFYLILDFIQREMGKSKVDFFIEKAYKIENQIKNNYPDIYNSLNEYSPNSGNFNNRYFSDSFNVLENTIPCIFLENGKCSIYKARPVICRLYGIYTSCPKINNFPIFFNEMQKMAVNSIIIKGTPPIISRPYPIFYWFSFFLRNEYSKKITYKNLDRIRTLNESDYYQYKQNKSAK